MSPSYARTSPVDDLVTIMPVCPMRIRARSRVTHVIDDCIISHSVILAASTKLMKWPVVIVYNSVLPLQQAQVQKWGMGNLGTYYLTASDRALEYSCAPLGTVRSLSEGKFGDLATNDLGCQGHVARREGRMQAHQDGRIQASASAASSIFRPT